MKRGEAIVALTGYISRKFTGKESPVYVGVYEVFAQELIDRISRGGDPKAEALELLDILEDSYFHADRKMLSVDVMLFLSYGISAVNELMEVIR